MAACAMIEQISEWHQPNTDFGTDGECP